LGRKRALASACLSLSRTIHDRHILSHFRYNRTTLASFRQLAFNIGQPDLPNRLHHAKFTIVHDRNRIREGTRPQTTYVLVLSRHQDRDPTNMTRNRLIGAAFLMIVLLPGCGIFANRPGLCNRNRGQVNASPVSMPVSTGDPGCGAMVIPSGTPFGGPFSGIPGPGQMESLPPPAMNIPKARIEEGKGKPFELDSASRTGPALTMPAVGSR